MEEFLINLMSQYGSVHGGKNSVRFGDLVRSFWKLGESVSMTFFLFLIGCFIPDRSGLIKRSEIAFFCRIQFFSAKFKPRKKIVDVEYTKTSTVDHFTYTSILNISSTRVYCKISAQHVIAVNPVVNSVLINNISSYELWSDNATMLTVYITFEATFICMYLHSPIAGPKVIREL